MANNRTRDKVRDGYLGDLPESIRIKVMNIHKLIKSTVDELIDSPNYDDLKSSRWAMSCIDDFCVAPKDKSDVGSARVFKSGPKKFRCSIQATGQFRNHQYGWIEELLHDFMGNVFTTVRPTIRKKYDMTIINDGRTGNPFEGYTIETTPKVAQEIWDLFEDKKTKTITEDTEINMEYGIDSYVEGTSNNSTEIDCGVKKLPKGLAHIVSDMNQGVKSLMETLINDPEYAELKAAEGDYIAALNFMIGKKKRGEIGRAIIKSEKSGIYTGEIQITPMPEGPLCEDPTAQKQLNKMMSKIKSKLAPDFNKKNPGKKLVLTGPKDQRYFIIALESDYAEKLFNYIKNPKAHPLTEAAEGTPAVNTDMSEAEAKRTMRTLTQSLINDFKSNKSKKMTQYTANIYANIITKNLLPNWAGSFRKFSISLDDYQSFPTVEFKIPKMTQDFVGRFVQGRESLEGFLHRQTEIKLKMSPRVFHTMKNPDDAYNFFKAAIQYYDKRVGNAGEKLMAEAMRLSPAMKHLVGTSKLSGIVTFPMTLLFVFDDVDMSDKNTFQLSQEDIRTVSSFIKNISSHYAAPEKEKKQIVDDVQKMVKTLRESCSMDENLQELYFFPGAVQSLYEGKFDQEIKEATVMWEEKNIDFLNMRQQKDPKVKYLQEAFGVKKLKKIPADLVAYIQIETECIKDGNDKMMISSYCLSKIEIVEWYIELLTVGSKKYVVPHTKPWLENMRTQLLACFKKIMATPIPKADRPIIDIQYPKGYEG